MPPQYAYGAGPNGGRRTNPYGLKGYTHRSHNTNNGNRRSPVTASPSGNYLKCPMCPEWHKGPIDLAKHLIPAHGGKDYENAIVHIQLPAHAEPRKSREAIKQPQQSRAGRQQNQLARDSTIAGNEGGLVEQPLIQFEGTGSDYELPGAILHERFLASAQDATDKNRNLQLVVEELQAALSKNAAEWTKLKDTAAAKLAASIEPRLLQLGARLLKDPFNEQSARYQLGVATEFKALKREWEELARKLAKTTRFVEEEELADKKLADEAKRADLARRAEQAKLEPVETPPQNPAEQINEMTDENLKDAAIKVEIEYAAVLAEIEANRAAQREKVASRVKPASPSPDGSVPAVRPAMTLFGGPVQPADASNDQKDADDEDSASDISDLITF